MTQSRFIIGRWVAALLAIAGFSTAIYHVVADNMPKGEVRVLEGYTPWPDEVLDLAETLPVQDGGRVKPLSTFAGFKMLQLHGARSMKISDGNQVYKIKPTEWLLDTLLRPQFAYEQPTFRVDNSDALEAIGVDPRGRRDRYSYEELAKGRAKLMELSDTYRKINSKERDPLQSQVVDLAENVKTYEALFAYFTFARNAVVFKGLRVHGETDYRTSISEMMKNAPLMRESFNHIQARPDLVPDHVKAVFEQILQAANFSKHGLFLLPPQDRSGGRWNSAGELIMGVMNGAIKNPDPAIEDIKHLEALAWSVSDRKAFLESLENLHASLKNRALESGQYEHVEMEAMYYRRDFFLNALALFLAGSLTALAMWSFGRSRIGRVFYWITCLLTAAGAGYCVTAIVIRCLIMERPPVGNLYDTIIFIGATITLTALITEWMTKRRFALGLGPILGTGLILLARRFELGDASDHMDPLVAVLDSNYWLTTHVITITLGYSAGLLAAFLSAIYVLVRGLGLDRGSKEVRRTLTRAVYGMLCFTLLLSLVGTVLGGIWANDSWGRFWGWDPKENGALLIVLWTLAILHARLGGYIREWGIHLASLFTAVVVTFSWWHVNFLGVGLHNYGFTSGRDAIDVFYIAILTVMGFGAVVAACERHGEPSVKS